MNRVLLRQAVEAAQREQRSICVVHIDLDRFHQINQRWGQHLGDQLLEAVGAAILAALPDGGLLAGSEGDAFVAIVPTETYAEARVAAQTLLLAVRQPIALGDLALTIEASAGFAHSNGDSSGDLLEQAFLACRRAKTTMRGSALGYENTLGVEAVQRLRSEEALRTAIAGDELRLHLQPTVDLRDGRVVGVEALIRWQHAIDGLLAPAAFLPIAESAGLMTAIGDWVLREAIRFVGAWRADGREPRRIWVNLAAQQLADTEHLYEQVRAAMDAGLIDAHDVGFEVTESSLLEDLPSAVGTLSALRGLGLEIALDDFGTGYSSLTYLQQLPVTAVKIDRSFVAGIGGSLADEAIVEAVIDLAHAMGLRVVAEGIEDELQASALIRMGADEAQGYYFGRPQPYDQIGAALTLPWAGATSPVPSSGLQRDRRADELPGFGSARARLLLSALDAVHDSIVVTAAAPGRSGRRPPIVYVNPAFEAETGFLAADVVGKTIEILLADPADSEPGSWLVQARDATSSSLPPREVASRRADGSTFLCEVTLTPILDERGIHTHWLHVRRDLSYWRAEQTNRQRFQGLLEQSSSLVGMAESGGTLVYANAALRDAIGLGPDDPLDELTWRDLCGPQDADVLSREIVPAIVDHRGWSGRMSFVNRVTGSVTEVITDLQAMDDPLRPGVQIYAAISRDVTELNLVERAEQRRRELFGFAAEIARRALSFGSEELVDEFPRLLGQCAGLLGVDLIYVDTIDARTGMLSQLWAWRSERMPTGATAPAPVELSAVPAWVERLRLPGVLIGGLVSGNAPWSQQTKEVFPGSTLPSSLTTGLSVDGELLGSFGIGTTDLDRQWHADELATVQQIADTIANLLARRRAEMARRTSEQFVTAMLDNIGDVMVIIDRNGFITYMNPQTEVVTGLVVAEQIGRHFLELVHPDDADLAIQRFTETIANGNDAVPVTELRIVRADGSTIWFDVDTRGIEDPVLGGYVVSLRNVASQHAAAETAERRRERELVILELSDWALNVEFESIDAGLIDHVRRLGEVLQVDAAQLWLVEGNGLRTSAQWIRPGSGSRINSVRSGDMPVAVDSLRQLAGPLVFEDVEAIDEPWAVEIASVPLHDRSAILMPMVAGSTTRGVLSTTMVLPRVWAEDEVSLSRRFADVVAALLARQAVEASLQASRRHLAALLDGSFDIVVVVSAEGEILYANRAILRALGYQPERIVGTNMAEILHPDDLELAAQRLQSLVVGSTNPPTTLRAIAADGAVHWLEILSGVMVNPMLGGQVLTCRDITDRHAGEMAAATRVSHLRYAFEVAQAALDLTPDEFLDRLPEVCDRIGAMLGVDFVFVDRIDEHEQLLINLAGYAADTRVQSVLPGQSMDVARLPAWVARLGRLDPVMIENAALCDEQWAIDKCSALGSEAGLMAVPMSAAGQLLGVLGVSMVDKVRHWTDDDLTFLRIVAETIAHVLERHRVDDALRRSETRFRLLSETAADVVLLMDASGVIQYASPSSVSLLGLTPEELSGQVAQELVHPDDVEQLWSMQAVLQRGSSVTSEGRLKRADGAFVWVANSVSAVLDPDTWEVVEYRASVRDISDRKRLEVALEEQALHDPLTGLGNRILLQSRLRAALESTDNAQNGLAVLLVDLDGFKSINDSYGHAVGDDVLRIVAGRLKALTRRHDTLARTGGDEFVVICPNTSVESAVQIGERIVEVVGRPLATTGRIVQIGASVGVSHHASGSVDPGWLLIDADHAMYAAKREGRARVRIAESAHSFPSSGVTLET